jgi:hypothetical protein
MKNIRLNLLTIFVVVIVVLSACSSAEKSARSLAQQEKTANIISSGQFEISNSWASPVSGGQINLIGNPNYIKFKNDSVDLFLPYFGVRHSGGAYNSGGGITYKGLAENLESIPDAEKDSQVISFETEKATEDLSFRITIYANGKTNTNVNSSQRSNISYRGEVKELETGKNK